MDIETERHHRWSLRLHRALDRSDVASANPEPTIDWSNETAHMVAGRRAIMAFPGMMSDHARVECLRRVGVES